VKATKQRHIQTRRIDHAARTKNGIPRPEILFQLARIFVACLSEIWAGILEGNMEGLSAMIRKVPK
jgi:hypothetical protein